MVKNIFFGLETMSYSRIDINAQLFKTLNKDLKKLLFFLVYLLLKLF